MFLSLKKRSAFIKRVSVDIWGHHALYGKISRAINFVRVIKFANKARYHYYKRKFVFTFRKRIFFRRRTNFKKPFIYPRYLQNFYLVLSRDNFRRYMKKAKRQHGYFIGNYLRFLECRLYMIVYRSNLVTNLFMIRNLMRQDIFFLNGSDKQHHYNYVLNLGDFLYINPVYLEDIKNDILLRFSNNVILWTPPCYLYINYNFMFIIFKRKPKLSDIFYPIRWIDPLIGSEYYLP